jgi:hypothetical protein
LRCARSVQVSSVSHSVYSQFRITLPLRPDAITSNPC